ncbi:MAG TPA: L,D-transpeptidase [Phenylobacterium sp.]|jgi:lipoprotein-anchoring transpeptidase ErfK/SrfK
MKLRDIATSSVAALMLAACSDNGGASKQAQAAAPAPQQPTPIALQTAPPPPDVTPVSQTLPDIPASTAPAALTIDGALWSPKPATPQARRDAMVRAQVLLARAHFSPGVIDGQDGDNVRNAISAYETAHDLPVDGAMDPEVWSALSADARPVLTDYVITEEDEKGPFFAKIPTDMVELSKLPEVGFTSPVEELAERFHMDEALLKALNPAADFGKAGTKIVVAGLGPDKLPAPVTRIEVDKGLRQVRAFGGDMLLAVYPATVGSAERPAPVGDWAVRTVAPNPTYTYDPSRLTFGKAAQGKLTIKAGPNNPVGSTWIDLTKDTYGIHGTPDPRMVGKTASHGCVRLTNWDVRQLAQSVKKGTVVEFVGVEQASRPKATPG